MEAVEATMRSGFILIHFQFWERMFRTKDVIPLALQVSYGNLGGPPSQPGIP